MTPADEIREAISTSWFNGFLPEGTLDRVLEMIPPGSVILAPADVQTIRDTLREAQHEIHGGFVSLGYAEYERALSVALALLPEVTP